MKKTLTFLLAIMANACIIAASYTVAGSSAAVFGTVWDPSNTNNDMTLVNGVYYFTKEGVSLPEGEIEFKVCLNHAWTTCWPSENYKLTIDASGIYDLTFTFIESSKTVGAAAAIAEEDILPSIAMHGNFSGSWNDTENFLEAEDKLTASLKMTLVKGNYEFGMRIGGSENWTSNGIAFTRNNATAKIEEGSGNLILTADTDGEYVFTWTYATNTLTISFPQEIVDPEDPEDPKEPTLSGFCGAEGDGSNLAWALYVEDSLLVITGQGEMKNWGIQTMVPWYGYNYGMNVTSISLPEGLTSIGSYAFGGCNKLKSIKIPNSVTSIGICAFEACYALDSIDLPEGITEIKNCTFRYSHLKYINIPNSVISIGMQAFYSTSLESIVIPNSVTSIGQYAFYGCPFNFITCEAVTPPTLGFYVFYNVNTSIPLYVPAESVSVYKYKDQWRDFIVSAIGDLVDVENTSLDSNNYIKYFRNGQLFILRGDKTYTVQGQEVR